jgi:hypothetical protein
MPGMIDPRSDTLNNVRSLDELTREKEKKKRQEAKELKIKHEKAVKEFERACQNPLDSKNAAKIAQKGQKNQKNTAGDTVKTQ